MNGKERPAGYPKLFEPARIRDVELRNRICFAAHLTAYSDGRLPSAQQREYYRARAKGGAGLIVTESAIVHPTSQTHHNKIDIADPACVPGFAAIVEACHAHGTKVFTQLTHNGHSMNGYWSGLPAWAPSPVAAASHRELPHEMTRDEVRELVEAFAQGARNAREAGADGVEVHGAHGYLIQQFLSPLTNHRTDEYGGSAEGRLRFATEVLAAVRAAVGDGLAMGLRISADEFTPGGLRVGDVAEICRALASRAGLDYVSVSAGLAVHKAVFIPDMSMEPGLFADLSATVRDAVDIPVAVSGRINTPEVAERILEAGQADLVCLVRALIADPEWPAKAAAGQEDVIAVCPAFNQECRRSARGGAMACVQNPETGRELELSRHPVAAPASPRAVMVVGSGPGGLEAARMAATRGHRVSVWERGDAAGGQVRLAALGPHRADVMELVTYRVNLLRKLGVPVHLGAEVDAALVRREAPDVVVLATGSRPAPPPVEGADGSDVVLATGDEVLDGRVAAGPGTALVVEGPLGGWECYSSAEALAHAGRRVVVVSPWNEVGWGVPDEGRSLLRQRLHALGVELRMGWRLSGLTGDTALLESPLDGAVLREEGLALLVQTGTRLPRTELRDALAGGPWRLELVGDVLAPRQATEAIRDGYRVGVSV